MAPSVEPITKAQADLFVRQKHYSRVREKSIKQGRITIPKFDKAAKAVWQREYMREYRKGIRRRAKAKAAREAAKENGQ